MRHFNFCRMSGDRKTQAAFQESRQAVSALAFRKIRQADTLILTQKNKFS